MPSLGVHFAGLELLATAVVVLDDRFVVRYANPAAESLLATGAKSLIGQPFPQLFSEREAIERALGDAVNTHWDYSAQSVTYSRVGRDPLPLTCTMTRIDAHGLSLLAELRPIEEQLRYAREERLVSEQQANRELIRNLAHEIKNPLGGIRGAAQLLERELGEPELREFTQVIVKEADRLQSLMNRLLTPNRLPLNEQVNIHEVMERVRTLLHAEFPEGLEVKRDYDTSLPEITGDKEQLIQAILNVARNAAQATGGLGEIRMVTRIARQVTIARMRYRHAIAVSIEDDGPGVPAELAERIFYPLVSGRQGGTGLGLSLAQSFVSQHHGLIEFESVPGHTRFTLLLPLRAPAEIQQ